MIDSFTTLIETSANSDDKLQTVTFILDALDGLTDSYNDC
jgi:hypothetical protein